MKWFYLCNLLLISTITLYSSKKELSNESSSQGSMRKDVLKRQQSLVNFPDQSAKKDPFIQRNRSRRQSMAILPTQEFENMSINRINGDLVKSKSDGCVNYGRPNEKDKKLWESEKMLYINILDQLQDHLHNKHTIYELNKALQNAFQGVSKSDSTGRTLLHYAVFFDYPKKLIRCMLELKEIEPNAQTDDGLTALHHAVIKENIDLVRILAFHPRVNTEIPDNPAYATNRDCGGKTPLDLALEQEDSQDKIILPLLTNHVIYKIHTNPEESVSKHSEVIRKMLIKHLGHINFQDCFGWSILHYAAKYIGDEAFLIPLLLMPEVNPNVTEKENEETSLIVALNSGNKNFVNFVLCLDQINPLIPTKDGLTAVDYLLDAEIGNASKKIFWDKMGSIIFSKK